MKIKFIDDNLVGQKGLSKFLDPQSGWERNIEDYDIAIYTDNMGNVNPIDGNKINCSWIIEPPIINGENYLKVVNNKEKFKYIFSYIKDLSTKVDNFVFVPHGGSWLDNEEISIYEKSKMVSSIFSWKTWNPFHRMRFRVYDRFKNDNVIDFYGSGCEKPIEKKVEALKDYRFSIVIENSIESDYFTEKLLDCFLTGTIPIYVGSKSVSNYFDQNGIIFFDGDEDLPKIISNLSIDLYDQKIESVRNNFELAKKYIHPENIINEFLKQNLL